TADLGRIWRVSEGLDYGMVGVNETAISSEVIPFGGKKASGMGREGSRHGVDDYLEIEHIFLGIGQSPDNCQRQRQKGKPPPMKNNASRHANHNTYVTQRPHTFSQKTR